MPNHITNILTVSGTPEEVERFRVTVSTENPALQEKYMKALKQQKKECEDHLSGKKKTYYTDSYIESQLKEVLRQLKAGIPDECVLDFEGTIPMPEELIGSVSGSESAKPEWQRQRSKELIKKYGADNWYDFNLSNYGTKWNAYSLKPLIRKEDGSLTYQFCTAWSCPSTWINKTAEMFPTLTFIDAWRDEGGGAGLLQICVSERINTQEELDDRSWLLEYEDQAKEEYKFITQGDYEKVIERYSSVGYGEYSAFDEDLLKRIKDQDLPLFINYEWWEEDKNSYLKRMNSIERTVE